MQWPLTCKALIVVQKHVLVLFFKNKIFISFSKRFFEGLINFCHVSTKAWPTVRHSYQN